MSRNPYRSWTVPVVVGSAFLIVTGAPAEVEAQDDDEQGQGEACRQLEDREKWAEAGECWTDVYRNNPGSAKSTPSS